MNTISSISNEPQRNWAGNLTYSAAHFHYPETVEQLQELVSRSASLKVLGSGHSFNTIADTTGDMISLARLKDGPVLTIDGERQTATVAAGVKYGEICRQLWEAGFGLPNLASLPHISIAGACATATHGSGDANGNLATAISAIELVRADGELVRLSREQNGEEFLGVVVNLGALGVVTKLTLDLLPAFEMTQSVYEGLSLTQLQAHFDEIETSAYSVSLFTDWRSDMINQVWLKRQVEDSPEVAPAELWGAKLAAGQRHPIPGVDAQACTPQLGLPGPWYDRLPHFRMDFTPSSGEELQSEYLVPRSQALAAIEAVNSLRDQIAPLLQISEIRTIAADELWLSPCYRQPRVGLHFTWHKDWEAVRRLLPVLEEKLTPLGAAPHWGKLFTMPPAPVQAQYPRLADFRRLRDSYDPQGKFRNEFLATYLG